MAASETVLFAGLAIGVALGALSRWSLFCTFGAVADVFVIGDHQRLRGWALAIACALVGTQAMHLGGWIDLGESFYLSERFGWAGAVIGGFCFGIGMALVGTCSYGSLIRLGGGDLKSLVVMLVIAITAYMTLHGPLAFVRVQVIGAADLDLWSIGSQGLPEVLSAILPLGAETVRILLVAILGFGLLVYCFADRRILHQPAAIVGGGGIGLLVVAGWFATGVLGHDEFDPERLRSLSFVRPVGDSLMYAMTSTGSRLDFGIVTVIGVIAGAAGVSLAKSEFTLEGFDSDRQMLRHIAGGALMGFGGVTALGCTIGQGISAISALALSAPLALAFIFLGAYVGLEVLLNGPGWLLGAVSRSQRSEPPARARERETSSGR